MDCVRGLDGQGQYTTLIEHSVRLPEHGAFFVRHRDNFIGLRVCCRVVSTEGLGKTCKGQRIHQNSGLTDLTCILERVLGVCKRGLGIAKYPQDQRPKG